MHVSLSHKEKQPFLSTQALLGSLCPCSQHSHSSQLHPQTGCYTARCLPCGCMAGNEALLVKKQRAGRAGRVLCSGRKRQEWEELRQEGTRSSSTTRTRAQQWQDWGPGTTTPILGQAGCRCQSSKASGGRRGRQCLVSSEFSCCFTPHHGGEHSPRTTSGLNPCLHTPAHPSAPEHHLR